MTKISTKAKAFGTFVSPTTGSILYVDPDHQDEQHHSPEFTPEEAKVAFERGLIEDPDADEVDTSRRVEQPISELGTSRSEELANELGEDAQGTSPNTALDSRQTTAWGDAGRVLGGAEGFAQPNLNAPPVGNAVDLAGADLTNANTTAVTEGQPAGGDNAGGDDDDSDAPPAPVTKPVAAKPAAAPKPAAAKPLPAGKAPKGS